MNSTIPESENSPDVDDASNEVNLNPDKIANQGQEMSQSLLSSRISELLCALADADPSDPKIMNSLLDKIVNCVKVNPAALHGIEGPAILSTLLTLVEKSDNPFSSRLIMSLSELLSLTISPKCLHMIIKYLLCSSGIWRRHSFELLHQLKIRSCFPHDLTFFSFPGTEDSLIVLPPISKWPSQNGWSFQCWFYVDSPTSSQSNIIHPIYLFSFRTTTSLGYSAHMLGNFLIITSLKASGKGLQHCIPIEFHPHRWYMLTICYIYSRWSRCELRCYVDGRLASNVEMAWVVNTNENFDKCSIGGIYGKHNTNSFVGKLSSIFVFSQALSPQQIAASHKLGPMYGGQFRFELESKGILSDTERRALYENKLASCLIFAYSPTACIENLCLDQCSKNNPSVFLHSSHALIKGNVKSITTMSFHTALQSIGGIQILYLLFDQLDLKPDPADYESCQSTEAAVEHASEPFPIAAQLFNLIFDLVRTSPTLRKQLTKTNGLLIISQVLARSSSSHLNDALLNGILEAVRYVTKEILENPFNYASVQKSTNTRISVPLFVKLLRQLFDHLLFAHNLWIRAPFHVQERLYEFLADEFRIDLLSRCTKTIVSSTMNALAACFCIKQPVKKCCTSVSVIEEEHPPIIITAKIRSSLLLFIRPLFLLDDLAQEENVDCLLNYLSCTKEEVNLRDVLYFTVLLLSEYPSVMIPAFDKKDGIQCVFKLLELTDEYIRLYALKLFGFFLKFSKTERKQESTEQFGIFNLIGERLSKITPAFTMKTYNVLFELLTEKVTLRLFSEQPVANPDSSCRIENPQLLKTIAMLIINSKRTSELLRVRQIFLEHLLSFCLSKADNRRAILQMSVWQDWIIGLASLYPRNRQNSLATATVMEILRSLLYHALRFEFGGWRVWIDTLAILHSRMSFEVFRQTKAESINEHVPHLNKVSSTPLLSSLGKDALESRVALNGDLADSSVHRIIEDLVDQLDETLETQQITSPSDNDCDENSIEKSEQVKTSLPVTTPIHRNPHISRRASSAEPSSTSFQSTPPLFRLPPFSWSYLHRILLDSVLRSVEDDFDAAIRNSEASPHPDERTYKKASNASTVESSTVPDPLASSISSLSEFINDPVNNVYAVNLIHVVSQLADSFITACGGLLPLLAAATSPTIEIDLSESTHGLKLGTAFGFLLRITNLVDIVVFSTPISLSTLEKETGMSGGGILRQCLRLVCTCSVRNCLEARLNYALPPKPLLINSEESYYITQSTACPTKDTLNSTREIDLENCMSSINSDLADEDLVMPSQFCGALQERVDLVQHLASLALSNEYTMSNHFGISHQLLSLPESLKMKFSSYLLTFKRLPPNLQSLLFALQPILMHYSPTFLGGIFQQSVLSPLIDHQQLLQNLDLHRLRNAVYRDEEDTKQVQFMALAVVYFLSVLMVSKYRDLLDPSEIKLPRISDLIVSAIQETASPQSTSAASWRLGSCAPSVDDFSKTDQGLNEGQDSSKEDDRIEVVPEILPTTNVPFSLNTGKPLISSTIGSAIQDGKFTKNHNLQAVDKSMPPSVVAINQSVPASHESDSLTDCLERALGCVTPLLKEIFFDFAPFLSSTLLGSHGQELFSSGLTAVRQAALAVELVMLLCSQEWQNSLQKHAGLAFIELVNEGRLLAHATRDHILRVAQEADFILSRVRAVNHRHQTEFSQFFEKRQQLRADIQRKADQMLQVNLQRSAALVCHSLCSTRHILRCINDSSLFFNGSATEDGNENSQLIRNLELFLDITKIETPSLFYRLDNWEDDSRRRRRLLPNPLGSSHPEAVINVYPSTATSSSSDSGELVNLDSIIDVEAFSLPSSRHCSYNDDEVSSLELLSIDETSKTRRNHSILGDFDSSRAFNVSAPDFNGEDTAVRSGVGGGFMMAGSVSAPRDLLDYDNDDTAISTTDSSSTPCLLIAAGVSVHGTFSITKFDFSYAADLLHEENKDIDPMVLSYTDNLFSRWSFSDVRAVFCRRFLQRSVAVEIFITNRSSVMFAFPNQTIMQKVVLALPPMGIGMRYGVPQSHKISLSSPRQHFQLSNVTRRWQRREMSNFDYLMFLNTIAGRSCNDLNQYPIFPWVLSNYDSEELDLNQPANYRDLSKPIGALDASRKAFFDDRYTTWDDESQPAFHYGTHYSTSAFVLSYLIRLEPFTTFFLNMQGGKFDHPNRLFHSVQSTWLGCMQSSTNVKELIPEFFYLPEMFQNTNNYQLGRLDDGTQLDDVILPPWAKSPEEFVRLNRQALESELVSCQLHHWIDLIFGYKQRGTEAVRATNVFCHLTYDGSVNWSKITDPIIKKSIEGQIQSFGQTPCQLLTQPHPPRGSTLHVCPSLFSPLTQEVCQIVKLPSHSPVVAVLCNTNQNLVQPSIITVAANHVFSVHKWNNTTANFSRHSTPTPLNHSTQSLQPIEADAHSSTASDVQGVSIGATGHRELPATVMSALETSYPPPITIDTMLVTNPSSNRRYLGENYDPSLLPNSNLIAILPDNRAIISAGYFDFSIRVFAVDSGKLVQSVQCHQSVVTCLARSESNSSCYYYIASGARDGIVMLWIFNSQVPAFYCEADEIPSPQFTLVGHQQAIECIAISAELGLVISGSKADTCLIHTTRGEFLRRMAPTSDSPFATPFPSSPACPVRSVFNREGIFVVQFDRSTLAVYTLNGKLTHMFDMVDKLKSTSLLPDDSQMQDIDKGAYSISALTITPCSGYLVIGGNDGLVWLLRTNSLDPLHCLPRCKAPVTSCSLSHDQRFLVVGLSNGCLVTFNVDFNQWRTEFQERYST